MAVRISGITIPSEKKIEVALTYIYGIGPKFSKDILKMANIDPSIRVKDLKEAEANNLRDIIEKKFLTEGDLRREVASNIKRLKEVGSRVGICHTRHLPVHGQRTKTNSRTVRGNKRSTMGSGKSKAGSQKT
ncbi:MAG TPA: 30S ribosomal protein S13 [bacterium]|nr:30S ribosomal protein S13 [bacterium]